MNEKSSALRSALGQLGPIEAALSPPLAAALSDDLEDHHSALDPLQEQWLEEQSLFEASSEGEGEGESEEDGQHSDHEGMCYRRQACLIIAVNTSTSL